MTTLTVPRSLGGTLLLGNVILVPPSTGIALPLYPPPTTPFMGPASVFPVYALELIYAVNGILLDSQPYIATAPMPTGGIIATGSTFLLLFANPSAATQSALATGGVAQLTFLLPDGETATTQVTFTSVLSGGITFQVTVTILKPVITLPRS